MPTKSGYRVSVLFNEPKLLKSGRLRTAGFSDRRVSVLFNEPKLLKSQPPSARLSNSLVSVLFNEPKLLKCPYAPRSSSSTRCFSALQRAEIAEIRPATLIASTFGACFSALQRAEIAEMKPSSQKSLCSSEFQCSSTSRNC